MRSRRTLVIVLVVLASLLLVALLSSGDSGHQATRPTEPARPPGKTIVATIPANPTKPPVVKAAEGDLIELSVSAAGPGTVSLGGYDRVESVDATSPARFSLSADIPGEHPIELRSDAGSGEAQRVGVLRVTG